MSHSNTPQTVVAVDVGFGNTKMVCGHDMTKRSESRWVEAIFPSIAAEVIVDESVMGNENPDRILIQYQGESFYTGKKATSSVVPRIRENDYISSKFHEILLRTALTYAMKESNRLITDPDLLVLGLPVSNFANDKDRLKVIGMRLREVPVPKSLQRNGVPKTVTVRAKQVIVLPQPMGALRLAAQSLPSTDPFFSEGEISLVIDPGYRTLDWLTVENMLPDMRDSGSYDGGVSEILRELAKMIGTRTGLGQLDFDLIERGLKKGSIKLAHKDVAMQEFQAKIPGLAKKEVGAFLNRIPTRNQISRVILTGGGADYYKEAIAELMPDKDLMVQDDPVMGNVRGFWLAGCDFLSD